MSAIYKQGVGCRNGEGSGTEELALTILPRSLK